MREAVMSRGLFVAGKAESECVRPQEVNSKPGCGWNPQDFAREQVRGLVRQLFLSGEGAVRQVVFSPMEAETDVLNLCRRVAETLALETKRGVVLVGDYPQALQDNETEITQHPAGNSTLPNATRVAANLWLLPSFASDGNTVTRASLHSYIGAVRSGFEYSIVAGPPAAESTATELAQVADGIVLVLSARRTRRITARKIKEKLELAQARLLGIVLSDRAFPIPEMIYRRL
ncbi:MAG TPA: hypothetical protein VH350_03425 [Candidatus Sulfotelmatobacter sp.]|jgi:hypothetical protein|nr:hypothetical protein [Candidatus Sulfotelmatobacter sp.]